MREGEEEIDGQSSSSSSTSSIDSSNCASKKPAASSMSTVSRSGFSEINRRRDLSTDLSLALSISPPSQPHFSSNSSTIREQALDWPPIKSTLRSTLADQKNRQLRQRQSLFVKVYMEGIPIGRKLNLMAHHSYDELVRALAHMFRTIILCPNSAQSLHSKNFHVLTYEDQEGDWMMVGDVPWEMFLTSVKRMKITRADRC